MWPQANNQVENYKSFRGLTLVGTAEEHTTRTHEGVRQTDSQAG